MAGASSTGRREMGRAVLVVHLALVAALLGASTVTVIP
jgi:hypothetical protein